MSIELNPVTQEAVDVTDYMQYSCNVALHMVLADLQIGMSESDLACGLKAALAGQGVHDFWYDVPIMVLSGAVRFTDMLDPDYERKKPNEDVKITEGIPVYIDIHPRETHIAGLGRWGNLARTIVINPTSEEQVEFMKLMLEIEAQGIARISGLGATDNVSKMFTEEFDRHGINLTDVRNNFGHNMGYGPKSKFERSFLDMDTQVALNGQIWGVEPGGYQRNPGNQMLVARFEDCIHVQDGQARVLGNTLDFNPVIQASSKPYSKPR